MVITRAVVIVVLIDVTFVVGAEAFATSFVSVVGDLELGVVTVGDAALLFAEDEVLLLSLPLVVVHVLHGCECQFGREQILVVYVRCI